VTIGKRLKEERKRLAFTQQALAAIGQTTRKSQIDYENDATQPKAGYLAVLAKLGADVLYIITGQRGPSLTALSKDEEELLTRFRAAPLMVKAAALAVLQGAEEALVTMKTGNQANINGNNIGIAVAGDVVIKGQKKFSLNTPANQPI